MRCFFQSRTLGGVFLVAGTCIGAGMLGLPISTAPAGFGPSLFGLIFSWLLMVSSAFFFLEVSLKFPQESNLISMIKKTLGSQWALFAWCVYVLFLYALMGAYTTLAGGLLNSGFSLSGLGPLIVCLSFGFALYKGVSWLDQWNRMLMIGLIGSYCALLYFVSPEVSQVHLAHNRPFFLLPVTPLLITSFGFHHLIPSLRTYLNSDIKALRIALWGGSFLAFLVYFFWELLVLGSLPLAGDEGLLNLLKGEVVDGKQSVLELTQILSTKLARPQIGPVTKLFSFCAILTSFIGVSLGLFDFFADGLNISKEKKSGRFQLTLLTFIPPFFIAVLFPQFLGILEFAGIFGVLILLFFPSLLALKNRQKEEKKSLVRAVLVISVGIFFLTWAKVLHIFPQPW